MTEPPHPRIRLLVAESFELVRMGLRLLFENHPTVDLVADTHCMEDLLSLAVQRKPDVILLDLQLNSGNCIEHIPKLLSASPKSKLLAFTHLSNDHPHLQTFCSGAAGIIGKHHSCELLVKAIHAIHAGQIWFDRHISQLPLQTQLDSNPSVLTNSERCVASLACKGLSAREIGLQLSITEKTVRNKLSEIYKKTGVKKQIELCLIAFPNQLD